MKQVFVSLFTSRTFNVHSRRTLNPGHPILSNEIHSLKKSTGCALVGLYDQLSRPGPYPGHPLIKLPQAHHLSAGGVHQWSGKSCGKKRGRFVFQLGWHFSGAGSDGLPGTPRLSHSH